MLDIVIPCAGEGKRFREAGYVLPKPFMDVNGKPMITRVMDSIRPKREHRFQLLDRARVGETQGAVDTLLHADLDPNNPVLVANCDQVIDYPIDDFLEEVKADAVAVMTFTSDNPHHSYVKTQDDLWITDIVEKEVISSDAVVGVYWFATGQLLTDYAEKVIAANQKLRGEFYLSEMLKLMIRYGIPLTKVSVPNEQVHMLGTPEELDVYTELLDNAEFWAKK